MYLLDTNALSELLRRVPSARLVGRLRAVPVGQRFTASVALGELMHGAERVRDQRPQLLRGIESIVLRSLSVLPFDEACARQYGRLRTDLERIGTPIGHPDYQIAATALVHDLTLVTANIRHFDRVPGLRVANWLSPTWS